MKCAEIATGAKKAHAGHPCGVKYCLGVKFENYRNERLKVGHYWSLRPIGRGRGVVAARLQA